MTAKTPRGGQIGNKNAEKPRLWSDALRKHAVQNPHKVAKAAEMLWDKAAEGDVAAAREIADRMEGKPLQATVHSTEDGKPMVHRVELVALE